MFRQTINILGRASFTLFTLSLYAIRFGTMNIIRTIKNAQRQAEINRELRKKLKKIPESRLNGIHALPVELWSQILEHVLDPYLQHETRCYSLLSILDLRSVCRKSQLCRAPERKS